MHRMRDSFTTIFGPARIDAYTTDERLAFLQGYHDALASGDPSKPLRISVEREPPRGLEQSYYAGQAKAQSDLEEKNALDSALIVALIANL
jgi:hypothetical protein